MTRLRWIERLAAAIAGILLTPGLAQACATCTDPKEASRGAFIGVTMLLSLLPLAFMGAVGGYIHWRVRQRDEALASLTSTPPLPFPAPAGAGPRS